MGMIINQMRRRVNKTRVHSGMFPNLDGRFPMTALVHTLAVAHYLSFYRAAQALKHQSVER